MAEAMTFFIVYQTARLNPTSRGNMLRMVGDPALAKEETFSSKMLGAPCPTSGGNMLRMVGDPALVVEEGSHGSLLGDPSLAKEDTFSSKMLGAPCPTSGGNMLRMVGAPYPSNGGYIFFENAREPTA